jgi:hypothetical protein
MPHSCSATAVAAAAVHCLRCSYMQHPARPQAEHRGNREPVAVSAHRCSVCPQMLTQCQCLWLWDFCEHLWGHTQHLWAHTARGSLRPALPPGQVLLPLPPRPSVERTLAAPSSAPSHPHTATAGRRQCRQAPPAQVNCWLRCSERLQSRVSPVATVCACASRCCCSWCCCRRQTAAASSCCSTCSSFRVVTANAESC